MNEHEPPADGGGDAVNEHSHPADGGGDTVNGHEPAPDGGGDAVHGNEPVPDGDERDEDERLVALLRDLVGGDRKMKTAASLGVSYRTLDRALETGVLLPRIRDALKRRVLEEGGEAGLRHRARVEALERRSEALEERVAAVEQAQAAAAESASAAVGELGRRLEAGAATVEALTGRLARGGRGPGRQHGGGAAGGERWQGREPGGGPAADGDAGHASGACRGVVTLEPQPDEGQSYGAGMALVEEWRALVGRRGEGSEAREEEWRSRVGRRGEGSKAEQALRRERVMELEIALIGEHGLALPPNTEPLHASERERYLGWRRRELADLRSERRWRVALRWLRRVLTLGLWWR